MEVAIGFVCFILGMGASLVIVQLPSNKKIKKMIEGMFEE